MQYRRRVFPNKIRLAAVVLAAVTPLLGACGGSGGGGSSPPPPPPPPPPPSAVTVSGIVSYEFVPPNPVCQGLDFNSIMTRPIRGATVELLNSSSAVLATTTSGDTGAYSFTGVATNTMVSVRVRAELKRQGTPNWDVEVRDNVIDPNDPNPPVLGARPLYSIVGSTFDTGTSNVSRNLTATTGWDAASNSYTGNRAAAPFSILDAIYSAMQLIISVDPNAAFSPLDAFWSVNNTPASPTDIDAGELPTSFYRRDLDALFLLGDANSDTEEFDDHVIVHEWGHYFEDNFSRTDSIGGAHGIGDQLDPRLAFGEGWATALSGMALNNPLYCDTGQPGTATGFLALGAETGSYDPQGWYDEVSIIRFIYDLWDTTNDEGATGTDNGSIGFGPIYNVMVGPQAFTEAFTSIFSFAAELRATLPPADQAFLDSQLLREDMTPGFDIWGVGELNDAGGGATVLPVYTELTADGSVVNVCATSNFDPFDEDNKIGEIRFLRINVPNTATYDVNITTTTTGVLPVDDPLDPQDQSDPDIFIFRDGQFVNFSQGGDANQEIFATVLSGPDTFVAEILEYRYFDETTAATFPEPMCFDVSFTPQ